MKHDCEPPSGIATFPLLQRAGQPQRDALWLITVAHVMQEHRLAQSLLQRRTKRSRIARELANVNFVPCRRRLSGSARDKENPVGFRFRPVPPKIRAIVADAINGWRQLWCDVNE